MSKMIWKKWGEVKAPTSLLNFHHKIMAPNKKTPVNKSTTVTKTAYQKWWESSADSERILEGLVNLKTRMSTLPNNIGMINSFEGGMSIKLKGARLMSECDDYNKLCLSLTDEEYDFLKELETRIHNTMIPSVKMMNPKFENAVFGSNVRVSESTEQKYLKTKLQIRGMSCSMGLDVKGSLIKDTPASLKTVGSVVDVKIRIDGVYATKDNCGMMTKIDVFKIKSQPSEEELEEERNAKRQRLEDTRMQELDSF